ncbi:MAG: hypothetical protein AAF707_03635 [Pseudomonadota bacterium]
MIRLSQRRSGLLWNTGALAFCGLLLGCAVSVEPRLARSTGSSPELSQLHLLAADPAHPQRSELYVALQKKLEDRGIVISPEAPVIAELSLSITDASVGLYASEAGSPDTNAASMADPRRQRWYDGCKAIRVEASLAVFDRGDGALRKISEADSTICEDAAIPIYELAVILRDDLLRN